MDRFLLERFLLERFLLERFPPLKQLQFTPPFIFLLRFVLLLFLPPFCVAATPAVFPASNTASLCCFEAKAVNSAYCPAVCSELTAPGCTDGTTICALFATHPPLYFLRFERPPVLLCPINAICCCICCCC